MSRLHPVLTAMSVVAFVTYLAIGLRFGTAMHSAMPALNYRGVAYITIAWPFLLESNPIKAPIPLWVFSFKEGPQ